ncbi:hypothetical protein ABKV19_014871 [Rosa sericea]
MNCDGQLNKNNLAKKVKYILYQFVINFEYETGWYQRSYSSNKASFAGDLNFYDRKRTHILRKMEEDPCKAFLEVEEEKYLVLSCKLLYKSFISFVTFMRKIKM